MCFWLVRGHISIVGVPDGSRVHLLLSLHTLLLNSDVRRRECAPTTTT